MASFRDPARTFEPIEVIERLLEIIDYFGHEPVLYLSSSDDLATYLDSFGFDVYSLTANTNEAFDTTTRSVSSCPTAAALTTALQRTDTNRSTTKKGKRSVCAPLAFSASAEVFISSAFDSFGGPLNPLVIPVDRCEGAPPA